MYVGESVKLGIHGVEHVDDVDGLAGSADVREGHHVAEQNGARLEVPWKKTDSVDRGVSGRTATDSWADQAH